MQVHKATQREIESEIALMNAMEQIMDNRPYKIFHFTKWDDDDPDKIEILRIRKRIAWEESIPEKEVDDRIAYYEWIKGKFNAVRSPGLLATTALVLIDNVCDPTKDYLDYHPSLVKQHVAPEQ